MIKIRDFTFQIKSDLEIDIKYRDRLINKKSIECIQKVDSKKNFYSLDIGNSAGYCYQGYLIKDNNEIIKNISEVEELIK